MDIQVKIILAVIGLYNLIQSYQTIGNIYDKAQLDAKCLLMHLFQGEKKVVDPTIYTSANTSKGDRV